MDRGILKNRCQRVNGNNRYGVIHGIFISIHLNVKLHIEKDNSRNDYKIKVEADLVIVQTCTEQKKMWASHLITYCNLMYILRMLLVRLTG